MSRPLFEVGEVVLLRSKRMPHMDGEYSVIAILYDDDVYLCHLTGNISHGRTGGSHSYVLDDGEVVFENEKWICCFWTESALRKKHQPGEQSFRDLMQSLKQGQPA
ncbi:hypothetical protein D3C85_274360 [compost metagenome]